MDELKAKGETDAVIESDADFPRDFPVPFLKLVLYGFMGNIGKQWVIYIYIISYDIYVYVHI